MSQSWTKAKVRDAILGLHQATGKLNSNFAQLEHRPLYMAAVYHFGSWRKAIEFAGFQYADVKIKERHRWWTRERVIAQIVKVHMTEGKLNSNYTQVHHAPLYQVAIRLFGSWQKAVEAAGFDYQAMRARRVFRNWSKKAIVAELKRRHAKGLRLNARALCQEDRGLYQAARRYFGKGGWNKALQRIGLSSKEVYGTRIWTKAKVVAEIRRLYAEGTPLYGYYLHNHGFYSLFCGGLKVFGSWRNAIEAAGYKYEDIKAVRKGYWTQAKIIEEIQALERSGVRLSSKYMQHAHGDIFASALLLFGSWS